MQNITTACAEHACGKIIDQGRVAKAYLSMGTGRGDLPQFAAEAAKDLEEHQLLAEQRSEVSTRGTFDRSTLTASERYATDSDGCIECHGHAAFLANKNVHRRAHQCRRSLSWLVRLGAGSVTFAGTSRLLAGKRQPPLPVLARCRNILASCLKEKTASFYVGGLD